MVTIDDDWQENILTWLQLKPHKMCSRLKYKNLQLNFCKCLAIKLLCAREILCPCRVTICNASFTFHLSTFILSWEKRPRMTVWSNCRPSLNSQSAPRVCSPVGVLWDQGTIDMIFQIGRTKKFAKVTWAKTRKILNPELRCGSSPIFKNSYNGGKCRIFFQKLKLHH